MYEIDQELYCVSNEGYLIGIFPIIRITKNFLYLDNKYKYKVGKIDLKVWLYNKIIGQCYLNVEKYKQFIEVRDAWLTLRLRLNTFLPVDSVSFQDIKTAQTFLKL
jgi:hypothetical protein